jgi:hypothetical protein
MSAPRRRRWWLIGLAAVAFAVLPGTIFVTYSEWDARRDLAAARAEIGRVDPAWRWGDLQAARRPLADAENSALRVLDASRRLPDPWRPFETVESAPGQSLDADARAELDQSLSDLSPVQQCRPDQTAGLKTEVARLAEPLAALRDLSDMDWGRYPSQPLTAAQTLPANDALMKGRAAARILVFQSRLQAQEGRPDDALTTTRAMLGVVRSLGDDGLWIQLLVRVALRNVTVGQVERVLAQGRPSPAALTAAQKAIERELAEPVLVYALRGERAWVNFMFELWETGAGSKDDLFGDAPKSVTGYAPADRGIDRLMHGVWGRHDTADMLRHYTRLVEAARRPPAEQFAALGQAEATRAGLRPRARRATDSVSKLVEAYWRSQALLASAGAALAAEQFRTATGRWPETPAELVPAYLADVPVDPFGGLPMRLKRLPDGLVIYSVGPNGTDDGGAVRRDETHFIPDDVGFQLWDVAHRRQPAPPRPPKPPPDAEPGPP